MPVTEVLMGPGDFTLQLAADAGLEVRRACRPGANIIITAVDLGDPSGVVADVYALAALAIYNGVVLDRNFAAGEIGGQGLLGYLETEKGYAGNPNGAHGDIPTWPATVSQVVAAWFTGAGQSNGLVPGTSYSPTATLVNGVLDQYEYLPPFKGPLDTIMAQTGNEYRCTPEGEIDWGVATSLFRSSPLVGIYPGHAGREAHSGYTLLDGAEVTVVETLRQFRGVAQVADPVGGPYTSANAGTIKRFTPAGTEWQLSNGELLVLDTTSHTDAINIGDALAAKYADVRREISIDVREKCVPKLLIPGDWIGLYDLANDIYDLTNQVDVEGGPIFPENIRCVGYTWPILRGMGVYVYYEDNSPQLQRITDYVEFENDEDGGVPATSLVIGDKPMPLVPSEYASVID